jgi:hypothetical protein
VGEYIEPTNEQLAKFLVVYASTVPEMAHLNLSAPILEHILDTQPEYRVGALKRHRQFQQEIHEVARRVEEGTLGCAHIRPNGKNCPNANEPGTYYCGLHQDSE